MATVSITLTGVVFCFVLAPGYNYPYFFLNWGSPAGALGFSSDLPYMDCVWWILALLLFLILIGLIYRAVINKIHTKLG